MPRRFVTGGRCLLPPKVISEILGHATVAFTMDTYTQVAEELADAAAAAIAGHTRVADAHVLKTIRFDAYLGGPSPTPSQTQPRSRHHDQSRSQRRR